MEIPVVELDGQTLAICDVVAIARGRAEARIAPAARERNLAALRLVRDLLDRGEMLYGTSTGVGSLRGSP
ncbi:MAG TPA: aromatic amino acid lyase, partial [Solirubrobacteraceae bacterium]|nr:aromatic amino acid lyase [Solirubrobacteraceae bacterium]